ncbi:hypothetical protein QFC21_000950 [Naganishia friedmannii]|uniref:Uncharacterized protein n=1 Tax=Naganishia friedmannii TaxID=89922 RepID=A0ACC2W868_9TREE|nr:hypothetical protein QFC21_000950 [Naganishia friedmannii]
MTSPSVETANLHAALGGMSLQSASAENTPSPTAQPALPLEANPTHPRSELSNEKAVLTSTIPTPAEQNAIRVDSTMSKPLTSAAADPTAPPRKKFVYDPTSMLLPHERLAQQRSASQTKPVGNGHTSAGNGQQPNIVPVHTQVIPQVQTAHQHHQAPPPPYSAVSPFNTSYGQMQAQQQIPLPTTVNQRNPEIGLPTRAAPPLPSSTNGTTAPRSKPNAQSVNRDTTRVDPNAVDPLHRGPIADDNAEAEDESEGEDEMGERKTSRGKKRVRSDGTASLVGSVGGAETQRGGTARGSVNSHPALLSDWEVVETLGTGTFGRVLLVRVRPSYRAMSYHPIFPKLQQPQDPNGPTLADTAEMDSQLPHYALKVLNKAEIVRLKQVEHINSERSILERVRHPFLVELYGTYQDHLNVYMLLSYIPGGELFSHLRRAGRFTADVTRFYLASIILAIDYLHAQDIIYRDLKPENLLLDRDGYLRIADFGFAKIVEDRTFTLCGTPEYLAPEIVLSKGHGKAVDWWALGILCFEMLCGYPIVANKVAFPSHVDPYAKDLIRRLLTADRSKRLGNLRGGARDVMSHRWFTGVDWAVLESKKIGAPIIPHVACRGDSQNFQRYAPPRPQELPGILGIPQGSTPDPYKHLFEDFAFPPAQP